MDILNRIYEFLAGPCLYITLPLCLTGLARKTFIITSGLNNGLRFFPLRFQGEAVVPATAFIERDRVLAAVSIVFHIAIFAAPLTARAHGILLDLAWGLLPPGFPSGFTGFFTVTAIFSGIFLLLRRTVVKHVFAVSSWKDYAAMICVLIPFVIGYLARVMIGPYEIMMIVHCAGAHILLLAIGWTRLGHMVFFTTGSLFKSVMIKGAGR